MTQPVALEGFDRFLHIIGKLNYCWTNTESLLIHIIAGLARCDKETALVIFLTLNTTRARVDLVERLAKLERTGGRERDTVLPLVRELLSLAALRNRYNHCIYSFDRDNRTARTILMRISDRKDAIKMGQVQDLDEHALSEMRSAIDRLTELNASLWGAAHRLGYPT